MTRCHILRVFFACLLLSFIVDIAYPQSVPANRNAGYSKRRKALIAKDSLQSFNASISLSKKEEAANKKLVALRKEMIHYYDSIHFFPPAHSFFKSREHIYATPLFSLLKKMPKGGVLHLHPSAGVSYKWVISQAIQEPNCYVYWKEDNDQFLKGQLHFYTSQQVPPGFYPVKLLHDSIADFDTRLYRLLTFDESIKKDSVAIWTEFEKRFGRIGGFLSYKPVFEQYLVSMFDTLIADGVQHVELREHLGSGTLYDLQHPGGVSQPDTMIYYLRRALEKVRAEEPAFTVTLIHTHVRFYPIETIRQDFIHAFALRKKYPTLVKGYDLVAHEDAGRPTDYYRQVWLMRDSLAKVYGIDMPLYFHDGESTWQHVENIYDAVLLGSPRIGHGFNLSFFPAAEAQVRRQNTCIEVCPLSNQILGYIEDLRMHPAHTWIKHGIQVSISPDDPAIFGYTGVTPDFWAIFLAWELDVRDLKKLCMNSILYSSLSKPEKDQALKVWKKKWEEFIGGM